MKKITLIILVLVAVSSAMLRAQDGYYNRHNVYDNFAYADYEFRHSNTAFHIDRYRGEIYYFHHYRANVYFVLVGPNVFVVPGLTFRHYMNRPNFHWVSRPDFIALSAVNFPYYDSYVRFGFYFDFYDHNPWGIANHIHVTRSYRNYYLNRSSSSRYYRNQTRINAQRAREMARVGHYRRSHSPKPGKNYGISRSNGNSHGTVNRGMTNYRNYKAAQRFKEYMGYSSHQSSGYSSRSQRGHSTGDGHGRHASSHNRRTTASRSKH